MYLQSDSTTCTPSYRVIRRFNANSSDSSDIRIEVVSTPDGESRRALRGINDVTTKVEMFEERYNLILTELLKSGKCRLLNSTGTSAGRSSGKSTSSANGAFSLPMIGEYGSSKFNQGGADTSMDPEVEEVQTNDGGQISGSGQTNASGQIMLSTVDCLPGSTSLRSILGRVVRDSSGEYWIVDTRDSHRVDLSTCLVSDGDRLAATLGSCVVASGKVKNDVFVISEMRLPEIVPASAEVYGPSSDLWGICDKEVFSVKDAGNSQQGPVLVFGDVDLTGSLAYEKSSGKTQLEEIGRILDTFSGLGVVPSAIALFLRLPIPERAQAWHSRLTSQLSVLRDFVRDRRTRGATHSGFSVLLMAGAESSSPVLPGPPLPVSGVLGHGNLEALGIFAGGNPTRGKVQDRTIQWFAHGTLASICSTRLFPSPGRVPSLKDVAKLMTSQCSLIPGLHSHQLNFGSGGRVSSMVSWSRDSLLRLYPLPDILVLSDPELECSQISVGQSVVASTGSFGRCGDFLVLDPSTGLVEPSSCRPVAAAEIQKGGAGYNHLQGDYEISRGDVFQATPTVPIESDVQIAGG